MMGFSQRNWFFEIIIIAWHFEWYILISFSKVSFVHVWRVRVPWIEYFFFSFFEIVTLLIKPFLVGKSNNFAYPCSMVDITSIFNKVLFLSFMSWIIQFATASLIFIPYLKIITHTIGFQIAKYFTMVYCLVDVYSDHVIRKTFSW